MESDSNNFKLNIVIYKYKFNEKKGFTVKIIGAEGIKPEDAGDDEPEGEAGDEETETGGDEVGEEAEAEPEEYDPYTMG